MAARLSPLSAAATLTATTAGGSAPRRTFGSSAFVERLLGGFSRLRPRFDFDFATDERKQPPLGLGDEPMLQLIDAHAQLKGRFCKGFLEGFGCYFNRDFP